jgi:hypothetical protein
MGRREWWSHASDKRVCSVVLPAQQLFELLSSRSEGEELGGVGGVLPAPTRRRRQANQSSARIELGKY